MISTGIYFQATVCLTGLLGFVNLDLRCHDQKGVYDWIDQFS